MLRIDCFSTLGCPSLSLRQSVALARSRGLDRLEVRVISGSTELPDELGRAFGEPARLGEFLAEAGVTIPVIGTSHRLWEGGFDTGDLERLAEWADAAGAGYLRVFDGDADTLTAADLDETARRLDQWDALRMRRDFKVRLIVETHGTLCSDDALAAFCARFPDLPVLWDTHHTWAAGNALSHTRTIIGSRLAHLHVKDSVVVEGKRVYVLPGEGAFPMAELADLLGEPDVPVSLEWEAFWHPELPVIEAALDRTRSWT